MFQRASGAASMTGDGRRQHSTHAPEIEPTSAAEATDLRVGPLVLNAGLYHAATLARDVVEADRLTDGRLQLGLGTGYLREEFDSATAADRRYR
jgi:alkanesulfonate monooxygenase SsuD/methylene tetrahydromethanopterin reductase-like flavin-dependent oxidoreductase (luciferase family)